MTAPADLQTRLERVKASVSILDVLDRLGVDLKGSSDQQVRCPFHADSRPSARVYVREGRIHCFTCSKGWDVVDAVREHHNLPGAEAAVAWLESEFDLGPAEAADASAIVRRQSHASPDALASLVERTILMKGRALGFDRTMRAWLVYDIATQQYRAGTMSRSDYFDVLHLLYDFE